MIYPVLRRRARWAGRYISSRTSPTHNALPSSKDNHTDQSQPKRKRFRHPLSIPDTQWNTITDEHRILHPSRQPPSTCVAEDPKHWETTSQTGGITVVHEMIIQTEAKDTV